MMQKYFDVKLAFSFPELVVASVIYCLPFMVHPKNSAFISLSPSLSEASYSLSKTKWQTLWLFITQYKDITAFGNRIIVCALLVSLVW